MAVSSCAPQSQRAGGREALCDARPRDLCDELGREDLAGAGGVTQPAREDDRHAVEVVAVGDGFARIDPDAQLETLAGGG